MTNHVISTRKKKDESAQIRVDGVEDIERENHVQIILRSGGKVERV